MHKLIIFALLTCSLINPLLGTSYIDPYPEETFTSKKGSTLIRFVPNNNKNETFAKLYVYQIDQSQKYNLVNSMSFDDRWGNIYVNEKGTYLLNVLDFAPGLTVYKIEQNNLKLLKTFVEPDIASIDDIRKYGRYNTTISNIGYLDWDEQNKTVIIEPYLNKKSAKSNMKTLVVDLEKLTIEKRAKNYDEFNKENSNQKIVNWSLVSVLMLSLLANIIQLKKRKSRTID